MYPIRALTSVLLAALFAAGGHGFSSVHHRHDDDVHRHHHHGGHHVHGRHDGKSPPDVAPATARSSSTHAHYVWLGVPLPFPVPVEDDSSEPIDAGPMLVTARSWEGISVDSRSGSAHPPGVPDTTTVKFIADPPSFISSAQLLAAPLCARAMHERSGVQLA